jgi:hypothetical protein
MLNGSDHGNCETACGAPISGCARQVKNFCGVHVWALECLVYYAVVSGESLYDYASQIFGVYTTRMGLPTSACTHTSKVVVCSCTVLPAFSWVFTMAFFFLWELWSRFFAWAQRMLASVLTRLTGISWVAKL